MEKILLTITDSQRATARLSTNFAGRYYAMLVSYARLFMKDDWAEDVVQDVFYNVWQNRAALDDSNSLYKYLLRSVYNRALNYLDKNRRAGDYRAYYQERIASMGSAYYAPDNSSDHAVSSIPTTCARVSTRRSSRCRPNAARCSD